VCSLQAGDETWAAILLRVLAFGLPLAIIIMAAVSCACQRHDQRR
jgi:hypothetical protein